MSFTCHKTSKVDETPCHVLNKIKNGDGIKKI